MCLFAYELRLVVPEGFEVRDPAGLEYVGVPVSGLAPGAVYDPGDLVTESPGRSRTASVSRSRRRARAMGRCQCGAGRGPWQVLGGLPAVGLQRARPAVRHGGRREAHGDARARRPCLCPREPGLPVAVAAHSAATSLRAQRARFSRSLRPLSAQGRRCRPSCAPSGRSPEVVRPRRRRADGRPSRPSARLWSFRSTRSRTWMAVWPQGLAPGTAAVAVERVSSGGRGNGSRRSSGRAQRRNRGVSTVRRRPRRSARPSGSCAHRPGVVHNRPWRAYGVPLKMGGRGRERRLTDPTQVLCLELLMEIG